MCGNDVCCIGVGVGVDVWKKNTNDNPCHSGDCGWGSIDSHAPVGDADHLSDSDFACGDLGASILKTETVSQFLHLSCRDQLWDQASKTMCNSNAKGQSRVFLEEIRIQPPRSFCAILLWSDNWKKNQ